MNRILGQDRAASTLLAALAAGRVHHAWIFSGPRGVGKFTAAVEFARVLLDPDAGRDLSGQFTSDHSSHASRLIDAGSHPDLHVIRKELAIYSANPVIRSQKLANIPLDVLREHVIGGLVGDRFIDGPAFCTAVLGHGKVFIIDEAELLAWESQNALLKALEEPPARTYLILITTRPDRLLPTIRSRCHHVRFGPLDDHAMATWLKRAAAAPSPFQGEGRGEGAALPPLPQGEGRGEGEALASLSNPDRQWILNFAEGSPGVALLAARYGFHHWHARLKPMLDQLDRGEFPVGLGETLAELVEEFAQQWVKSNDNASKDAANKDGARHVFALLSSHARQQLRTLLQRGEPAATALHAIELLSQAEHQLERNVNAKLLLENLVVQWAHGDPVLTDA